MHLTAYTDYTVRLLIHLAVQGERTTTIQEVAQRYHISRNHLMKVASRAVQAGFVESVRGRGGGLRLARPPAQIGLGEVLRVTEDDWNMVECFDPSVNQCAITKACGVRSMLAEALEAYFAVLDRYTLADAVQKRKALVQLLAL
jgi:Rrf2 family transcriptional regulator, nitric oxide-sensitive transcriptional repressor